jgi:hypothetical protein
MALLYDSGLQREYAVFPMNTGVGSYQNNSDYLPLKLLGGPKNLPVRKRLRACRASRKI